MEESKPYNTPVKVSAKLLPATEQDEPVNITQLSEVWLRCLSMELGSLPPGPTLIL